jgi:hypothetical protein
MLPAKSESPTAHQGALGEEELLGRRARGRAQAMAASVRK